MISEHSSQKGANYAMDAKLLRTCRIRLARHTPCNSPCRTNKPTILATTCENG